MATPRIVARVPDELESAARKGAPELATAPPSTLIRVGLAVLAGYSVTDAVDAFGPRGTRPFLPGEVGEVK